MPLNTTAEKVLNLSNSPNTVLGKRAVPIGPINIAARQTIAQMPRAFTRSFLAPIATKTKDDKERITTSAVTARCIKF